MPVILSWQNKNRRLNREHELYDPKVICGLVNVQRYGESYFCDQPRSI